MSPYGFIELTANSICRNVTNQMLIQLDSYFGGNSSMLSSQCFNARQSLSVSLEVRPKLLRLLEVI